MIMFYVWKINGMSLFPFDIDRISSFVDVLDIYFTEDKKRNIRKSSKEQLSMTNLKSKRINFVSTCERLDFFLEFNQIESQLVR